MGKVRRAGIVAARRFAEQVLTMAVGYGRTSAERTLWRRRLRAQISQQARQLLAAAAAIASISLALYVSCSSSGSGAVYDDVHLHCVSCGHEFDMTAVAVAELRGKAGDPGRKMPCPSCGQEAGEEMMQCRCGKWYFANVSDQPGAAKCPHCGFDPNAAKK